jgi:protein-S-isoprenylcysteine O-methyltransferase Ste14
VPLGGVVAGDVLVAIGFYLIVLVYRENTFTSATIEVAENQKVISTGPYAIVRHYGLVFGGQPPDQVEKIERAIWFGQVG